jgi:hypothetical protein
MVKTTVNERILSFQKQNKKNFKKIIKFEEFDNIEKGTLIYCFPKIKSNRIKKDKTETWEIHEYIKKTEKYVHLLDKYHNKWKLEHYYAGNTGRKGLFVWYNKKNRPSNWNCEYLIKIKNDDYKKSDKIFQSDISITNNNKNSNKLIVENPKIKFISEKENYNKFSEDNQKIKDTIEKENSNKLIKDYQKIKVITKNKIIKIKEGRWSNNEHNMFKEQLCIFYNRWANYKIYSDKGTRSINQIRSHSQKYFKRLNKSFKNKLIIDSTDEIIYISSCLIYLRNNKSYK